MKKIYIDEISHKILGYENIEEYTEVFKDDIIVHDDFLTNYVPNASYYVDGKLITDNTENFSGISDRILILSEELNKYPLKEKRDILYDLMFSSEIDDLITLKNKANEIYENIIKKRETILNEIELEKTKLKNTREELKLNSLRKWDSIVNPLYKSAICLLAKDEEKYLEEWINHHLNLGFEHIYIYDNNSKYPIKNFVQDVFSKDILNKLTVIDFYGEYNNIQSDCYNEFLKNFSEECRWVAFIDTDEFMFLSDEYKNINEFLDTHVDDTCICVDFIEYGANGQIEYSNKPVCTRFTKPVNIKGNYASKVIVKPYKITKFDTHYPLFNQDKHLVYMTKDNELVTHHYYTKSLEEWITKIKKGTCDPNWKRKYSEFFEYNPDLKHLYNNKDEFTQKYQQF